MIFKLIFRYSLSRSNRHLRSSIKIAITYAFTLASISLILALMSSLQISRFDNIRSVKSFDITVEDGDIYRIMELYPDAIVFEYKETYALLNGNAFTIRYIDSYYDGSLYILRGDESSMLVPYSLYLNSPSTLTFSTIREDGGRRAIESREFPISGVYYTALGEDFDSHYAFSSISNAIEGAKSYVAIKGTDDTTPLRESGITNYETWKEKESTLYAAFTLENTAMFLVLAVLLLIVYVEINQEVRIFLRNKRYERLELIILGLDKKETNFIFIASFLFILLLGASLSLFISLPLSRLCYSILLNRFNFMSPVNINFSLFLSLNGVFFLITALTVLSFLKREDKKSITEALGE